MSIPTGQQLKQARQEAGLTQEQAARMVWKTLNCWQKWEAGQRPVCPACWELFGIKSKRKR